MFPLDPFRVASRPQRNIPAVEITPEQNPDIINNVFVYIVGHIDFPLEPLVDDRRKVQRGGNILFPFKVALEMSGGIDLCQRTAHGISGSLRIRI